MTNSRWHYCWDQSIVIVPARTHPGTCKEANSVRTLHPTLSVRKAVAKSLFLKLLLLYCLLTSLYCLPHAAALCREQLDEAHFVSGNRHESAVNSKDILFDADDKEGNSYSSILMPFSMQVETRCATQFLDIANRNERTNGKAVCQISETNDLIIKYVPQDFCCILNRHEIVAESCRTPRPRSCSLLVL
jgi:hypothetical protein